MGATDIVGRIATSIFRMESFAPVFAGCHDVVNGGVLLALPALLVTGLLRHTAKYFTLPPGYYRVDTIFLLLAFMALCRIKTVEGLRYRAPGEWGKVLGLDRIPEAKTLREKIEILWRDGEPSGWSGELSREWMEMDPDAASILYVDGHVRVYSGRQAQLPRHYVSRQKLCLRATTDYWVNAMDGQPFFMINKAIDPGMIKMLEDEIVPRLEQEIPWQGQLFDMEGNPHGHRFVLVFDREGYSPAFLQRMREKRIACLTYHKYPQGDWPEKEFHPRSVKVASGNVVKMMLAERGVFLGKTLWVREIRRLTDSGHQSSIISTDYQSVLGPVAVAMFARWSQENFFKYMRQHYNLDRLIDYSTEDVSATTKVVNPQYREIDGEVRKQAVRLHRKRAEFGEITLTEDITAQAVESYQQIKADLREEIAALGKTLADLKACRRDTPKHVTMADRPEETVSNALGFKVST